MGSWLFCHVELRDAKGLGQCVRRDSGASSFQKNEPLVSAEDFKAAMRALPAGIAAITTAFNSDVAGMIVSSLTSVSADPPMIGFLPMKTHRFIHPS